MKEHFTIRPMLPEDRIFIRSGWSSSYRMSAELPMVPMRDYADIMHPIIDSYLDHPKVQTLVAVGELGVLFGFVSANAKYYETRLGGDWLHLNGYVFYLYVAGPFRRRKIARYLLAAAGIDPDKAFGYACSTRWNRTLRSKIPLAEYDTLRARYLSMEES